jgi:hypothetical protein
MGIENCLQVMSEKRERLEKHQEKTVAVISDSLATVLQIAHLKGVLGQRLARRIIHKAQTILQHSITSEI